MRRRQCYRWALVLLATVGTAAATGCTAADGLQGEQGRPQPQQEWEQKKNARTQRIVEAIRCREAEPALSDGELFARAMQDYWQREMHGGGGKDESLNHNYPGANGNIHVTDSDCGLIRDTAGQPLRIERDTCYPFRLDKYNTLDRVTERLKAVPEFGAKYGFDQPGRHAGGWIYDAIVGELLQGRVSHPDREQLYLPEHADGRANFAVLFKRGSSIRWYGPDCCRLVNRDEAEAEVQDLRRRLAQWIIDADVFDDSYLSPELRKTLDMGKLRFLRVSYHDVDFTLDAGQGGAYALARGRVDNFNLDVTKYYFVSSCGQITCVWEGSGPCSQQ